VSDRHTHTSEAFPAAVQGKSPFKRPDPLRTP
jgi:hypothetical protein